MLWQYLNIKYYMNVNGCNKITNCEFKKGRKHYKVFGLSILFIHKNVCIKKIDAKQRFYKFNHKLLFSIGRFL